MGMSPPHPFGPQYAPYLAASDGDASFPSGGGKGIQCPMSLLLFVRGLQLTASTSHQPPRRIGGHQSDDPGAFSFGNARLAPSARQIAKAVDPLSVEAMEALTHSLGVATQFFSDRLGAKSILAESDHPSAHYPIAGSVTAAGQLAHFLLLSYILRGTGV